MAVAPPDEPGRERLDAQIAGQKIALSTNNLIAVLFVGLIGLLLWLFAGSGQVILQRDIADRHRIAAEVQQDFEALRQEHQAMLQRLEQHHEADMARQLEVARSVLRILLNLDYNIRHTGEPEEVPFGTLPPWFTVPSRPAQ